jgi:hypothetical protein
MILLTVQPVYIIMVARFHFLRHIQVEMAATSYTEIFKQLHWKKKALVLTRQEIE